MSIEGSTGPLIANDKVEGTAVYDTNDQKIGTIAASRRPAGELSTPCWGSADFSASGTTTTRCPGTPCPTTPGLAAT